ncbi:MAG: RDD family protein [Puniceicoccaceae bacterium]
MNYFYKNGDEEVGPVTAEELQKLTEIGDVNDATLIRSEDGENWISLSQINEQAEVTCPNCGAAVQPDQVAKVGETEVCIHCKEEFVQRLREGAPDLNDKGWVYGGFWLRFGAHFIDSIILQVINLAISLPISFLILGMSPEVMIVVQLFVTLFQYVIIFGYFTYFEGSSHQATPGKKLCKLRVIREDGGDVGFGLAFGRNIGKVVSGLIFLIGFIMAGFDDEKRSLHDRMCSTRVIKVE